MTPLEFITAALAGAYSTYVLVYSGIAAPYRSYVLRLSIKWNGTKRENLGLKLQQLSECPYCTGFWVMLGFQVIFRFNVFGDLGVLGVALTHLALTYVEATMAFVAGHVLNRDKG